MNFKSICLVFLLFSGILRAQHVDEQTCGVQFSADPHFDLESFQKFIASHKGKKKNITEIPVLARIVRHEDQTGGLDTDLLEEIFDTLNVRFQAAGIQFYQCSDPEFVDVNIFYDFDRDLYRDSLVTYNVPNVINIYFINKVLNDDSFICGYASFPWRDGEYVVVKNSCALNGSTLAHELGHYLGLYHTHETSNGEELVDGRFCQASGDLLCDTPADPRLRTSNVTEDCIYDGSSKDANGDFYKPDPTNIMSYSRKKCRTYFSPEQVATMEYYLSRDRSHLSCLTTSIDQSVIDDQLKVFPNPFDDQFVIEIPMKKKGKVDIIIRNIIGKIVYFDKEELNAGVNTVSIAGQDIETGILFLTLQDPESSVSTKIYKLKN